MEDGEAIEEWKAERLIFNTGSQTDARKKHRGDKQTVAASVWREVGKHRKAKDGVETMRSETLKIFTWKHKATSLSTFLEKTGCQS